jgi:hypothetical protein
VPSRGSGGLLGDFSQKVLGPKRICQVSRRVGGEHTRPLMILMLFIKIQKPELAVMDGPVAVGLGGRLNTSLTNYR